MMRAPWMALLCAVFVSLFPLSAYSHDDDDCTDCRIDLYTPIMEPLLPCVRVEFELVEICDCSIKLNISNECSEELTVYKQASFTSTQCTGKDSDKCEILSSGDSIELSKSIRHASYGSISENIVFIEYVGEFHWLIFKTRAISSSTHESGCGGTVSPDENSLKSEMSLIFLPFLVASAVKRRVRESLV